MTYRWAPLADRLGYTDTRAKRAAIRRAVDDLTWSTHLATGPPLLTDLLASLPAAGPDAVAESAVTEVSSSAGGRGYLCGWRTSSGATFVALCTTTSGPSFTSATIVSEELVLLARRPAATRSAIAA